MTHLIPGYDIRICCETISHYNSHISPTIINDVIKTWVDLQKRLKIPRIKQGDKSLTKTYCYELLEESVVYDYDLVDDIIEAESFYVQTLPGYFGQEQSNLDDDSSSSSNDYCNSLADGSEASINLGIQNSPLISRRSFRSLNKSE